MRPYHSLVLAALVSLALAQEELGYDKLSYDELAELSYEKLEDLSFEQLEEIEELSYVRLSYDAMLAAEVSCFTELLDFFFWLHNILMSFCLSVCPYFCAAFNIQVKLTAENTKPKCSSLFSFSD